MSHLYDATLKSIVAAQPGDFASVFGLPVNEPVKPINVDLSTITAATDVAFAYGDPVHTIVDLNFQTGPDAGLPGRLLLYNAALYGRYTVPIRTILILLRPKADHANLTGTLTYGDDRCRVEFHYDVIRLWQQPVEDYLRAGVAILPLATLCRMPSGPALPDALRDVVKEIHHRLNQEVKHADAVKLMTAAYILSGLRVEKSDLATIYRGVGLMSESTAFDEAVEEGEITASRRILFGIGRKQFGDPTSELETEIKSIRDLDRLERMAIAILTAKSWQELLATA